jgi:hypothetical protein
MSTELIPSILLTRASKSVDWADNDDMETDHSQQNQEKVKTRPNKFDTSRKSTNSAKKAKPNAESTIPDVEDKDASVIMEEAVPPPSNPSFTPGTFFVWTQLLHDKDVQLPLLSDFTKVLSPHMQFTNAQFNTLETTRVTAAYSWAREAYDAMIVGVDAEGVLSAEEAEKYAVYVSVLRMEKLQEVIRMLNIDFADLASILDDVKQFTKEVKDKVDQWYKAIAQAESQKFLAYFEETTPELPERFHDTATFVWPSQSQAASVRIDKLVQYGIAAQVSTMADKYEELRDKYVLLNTTKSATDEEKTASQEAHRQIQTRARRLRRDAEALAQEAGMDVADRLEDF